MTRKSFQPNPDQPVVTRRSLRDGDKCVPRRLGRVVLSVILASLVFLVYLLLNTSFSFRFTERPGLPNYEMLAESFLAGQLYLKQPVDPSRLSAGDPRDPRLPYPFLRDALIFGGKYYFQHEPLPAVFRAVWIKFTGRSYSTGAIIVLCAWASFLLMGGILWKIRQHIWPNSRVWVFYYVWAGFGMSGPQLYIAAAPVVYNESVAMGCSFLLAGSYFLLNELIDTHPTMMSLVLSGFFFGAATACRAELVVYPIALCVTYSSWSLIHKHRFWAWLTRLFLFTVPVGMFVAVLLTYNYLRFGGLFDFGRSYLVFPRYITHLHATLQHGYFGLQRIPYQLYHYLLAPPMVTSKFPFLRYPFGDRYYGDVYIYLELVCSVFLTTPLLLLCLFLPYFSKDVFESRSFRLVTMFCLFSSVAMLGLLSTTIGCTARYMCDFTPLLYVAVFGVLIVIENKIKPSLDRSRAAAGALILLFVGQLSMGLLLGLTGMIQWPAGK